MLGHLVVLGVITLATESTSVVSPRFMNALRGLPSLTLGVIARGTHSLGVMLPVSVFATIDGPGGSSGSVTAFFGLLFLGTLRSSIGLISPLQTRTFSLEELLLNLETIA